MTCNFIIFHQPESLAGYQLCLYKYKIGKRCNHFLIHATLIANEHLKIQGKNDSFLMVQESYYRSVLSLWFLVSRQSPGLGIWFHLWDACLTCSKPWISPQLCTNQSCSADQEPTSVGLPSMSLWINLMRIENRSTCTAGIYSASSNAGVCRHRSVTPNVILVFVCLFVWFTEEEKISRILSMPQSRASKTLSTSSTFLCKNFSVISIIFIFILWYLP